LRPGRSTEGGGGERDTGKGQCQSERGAESHRSSFATPPAFPPLAI
jgi:hypothetical protein